MHSSTHFFLFVFVNTTARLNFLTFSAFDTRHIYSGSIFTHCFVQYLIDLSLGLEAACAWCVPSAEWRGAAGAGW
jgi:uncharacterized membrane protein